MLTLSMGHLAGLGQLAGLEEFMYRRYIVRSEHSVAMAGLLGRIGIKAEARERSVRVQANMDGCTLWSHLISLGFELSVMDVEPI
jgi:hypothetical protein